MSDLKTRVKKLEAKTPDGENIIWVDWGGPTVEINGETMTREEMERRYPDRKIINWQDKPGDRDEGENVKP